MRLYAPSLSSLPVALAARVSIYSEGHLSPAASNESGCGTQEKCILRRRERINLRPDCHLVKLLWPFGGRSPFTLRKGGRERTVSERSENTRALLLSALHTSVHRQELFTRCSQAVNHKRFSKETSECIPLSSYRELEFHQDSLAKVAGARFPPDANQICWDFSK